jgi:hypothetical protein
MNSERKIQPNSSPPPNEISIEELANQIWFSTISSPLPSVSSRPTPAALNDFNPRPAKRPHLIHDDRPNPNFPDLHDLDVSDEELKSLSKNKQTSSASSQTLPTIHEASNEENSILFDQTKIDEMVLVFSFKHPPPPPPPHSTSHTRSRSCFGYSFISYRYLF